MRYLYSFALMFGFLGVFPGFASEVLTVEKTCSGIMDIPTSEDISHGLPVVVPEGSHVESAVILKSTDEKGEEVSRVVYKFRDGSDWYQVPTPVVFKSVTSVATTTDPSRPDIIGFVFNGQTTLFAADVSVAVVVHRPTGQVATLGATYSVNSSDSNSFFTEGSEFDRLFSSLDNKKRVVNDSRVSQNFSVRLLSGARSFALVGEAHRRDDSRAGNYDISKWTYNFAVPSNSILSPQLASDETIVDFGVERVSHEYKQNQVKITVRVSTSAGRVFDTEFKVSKGTAPVIQSIRELDAIESVPEVKQISIK